MNYMHAKGIVHRDIKPENFMFETKDIDSTLKIIDFGLSKLLNTSGRKISGDNKKQKLAELGKMKTKAGTPCYVSPEVLSGNYGIECDMWSAGCLLYVLLCGYPPFEGTDDYDLANNIMKGHVDFESEEWVDISREAKHLIRLLICKPESRLTAEEALSHKWFKLAIAKTTHPSIELKHFKRMMEYSSMSLLKKAVIMAVSV